MLAAAWLMTGVSPASLAQGQTRAAADATPVDFDIASQPMASALNAWAVEANAQVFVDPGPIARLRAPAVKGRLPPRRALRALLAHSNLTATQGADGVFVIKPRAVVAAAPAPPEPAPAPPAATAPPPDVPMARQSEGRWLLRLAADFVHGNASASGGATATMGSEYFLTDHVAGELAVMLPGTIRYAGAGSARLQLSTLTVKYHFAPGSRLRPYVGAGLDIATQYDTTGIRTRQATVGAAAQAGLDVPLAPHWLFTSEVSWTQARPPVRIAVGIGYRF